MRLTPVLLALAFSAGSVFAADTAVKEKKPASPAQLAQQEKMKTCNADAKKNELKGDARKKFMSECLRAKSVTPVTSATEAAPATQQSKMKSCNAEAGEKALKGAERKAFMSECLKGSAE